MFYKNGEYCDHISCQKRSSDFSDWCKNSCEAYKFHNYLKDNDYLPVKVPGLKSSNVDYLGSMAIQVITTRILLPKE